MVFHVYTHTLQQAVNPNAALFKKKNDNYKTQITNNNTLFI